MKNYDPADVGNLISGSSAFSNTSLNIRKFTVHILLKPGLENTATQLIVPTRNQKSSSTPPFFLSALCHYPQFPINHQLQSILSLYLSPRYAKSPSPCYAPSTRQLLLLCLGCCISLLCLRLGPCHSVCML